MNLKICRTFPFCEIEQVTVKIVLHCFDGFYGHQNNTCLIVSRIHWYKFEWLTCWHMRFFYEQQFCQWANLVGSKIGSSEVSYLSRDVKIHVC